MERARISKGPARAWSALLLLAALLGGCGAPAAPPAGQPPADQPQPAAAPPPAADLEHGLACPNANGPINDPIVVNQAENLVGVASDGGRMTPLTALPSGTRAYAPVWSPDGRTLAFAYFFAPADPALAWLQTGMICGLDRQSGQGRILARGEAPVESLEEASWTPDGQSLVVTEMRRLFNANRELTGTETLLSRYDLGGGPGVPLVRDAIRPAVSPDGRSLAYIKLDMQSASIDRLLMVAAADGSQQRMLLGGTDGFRMLDVPRWSPDSQRLVVTGSTGGSPPGGGAAPARSWWAGLVGASSAAAHGEPAHLWLVSADGQQVRQITAAPLDDPHAAWAPVGEQIVYVTTLGAVVSHDLGSQTERPLTEPGFAGLIDWKWQD